MNDLLNTLSHTPLPTILVVAGIAFWVLAIAGSLAGKITVEPGKQKTGGFVGSSLIVLGLILFFAPPPHQSRWIRNNGENYRNNKAGTTSHKFQPK